MELYRIDERTRAHLDAMEDAIDPETGALDPVWLDQLDALDVEVKYKIESIGVVCRELKGDIATVKEEIDRLKARKASMEKRVEHLVDYVSSTMKSLGIEKHKSPNALFTVYLQRNPDKVEVDYPDNLPAKYQRITPVEPMLNDIRDAIKNKKLSITIIEKAGIRTVSGQKKVRYK